MKLLFAILGVLSIALGVIGIFLPLLPTTPFLLLSAALFVRSSPRLYNWLMQNPVLGRYITNYRENKAIPLRAKYTSITLIWCSLLYCIFRVVAGILWAQLLLLALAIVLTIHLLSFRSA